MVPGRYRRWIPVVTAALLGGSGLAVAGSIVWGWSFGLSKSNSNETTLVSAVVALAAFLLLAAGTVVAVIAYMLATGAPDLEPELSFRFSYPNAPVFSLDPESGSGKQPRIAGWRQVEGKVYLHNRSAYSAKHPGFRIDFLGLGGFDPSRNPGWTPLAVANMVGVMSIQWDGGADYLVHGRWIRPLPDLNFDGVFMLANDSITALEVTVAADGLMPQRSRIPVKCLPMEEYQEYTRSRAEGLLQNAPPNDVDQDRGRP